MPHSIRLWKISNERLEEVQRSIGVDKEKRLHDWLEDDISFISDDLLVIGREVVTQYGKKIDLLCIDKNGDLVVIELKRGNAPRDVIAQVLEYASWIDGLSADEVVEIANEYLMKKQGINLEKAFYNKFGKPLPEVINESHKILIVASELDDQIERVISYLSRHGININAITFAFFQDDNSEYIARTVLIPESIKQEERLSNKRRAGTLWTPELLKERLKTVDDETLRWRLHELIGFAEQNGIFYRSKGNEPLFGLTVKNKKYVVLNVYLNGIMHAYIGRDSAHKYPSEDKWIKFVNKLKQMNLLDSDFNPFIQKTSINLKKNLRDLNDSEFKEFINILKDILLG